MKKNWIAALLVCALLAGCGAKQPEAPQPAAGLPGEAPVSAQSAEPPVEPAEPETPVERDVPETVEVLDLRVDERYAFDEVDGGWAEVRHPVYELGCLTSDGETVLPDNSDALNGALGRINDALLLDAKAAWQSFGTASDEQTLYDRTDAFVTRADSVAVSFYEQKDRIRDEKWGYREVNFRSHNLDARTGEELSFADVFRDTNALPKLLLEAFAAEYPDCAFHDNAEERIRQCVESGSGDLCFALGYGFVHVFANEYIISGEPWGHHITLSYSRYPDLVYAFCDTAPERWIMPMDYGVTYWLGGTGWRMDCAEIPESDDVLWSVTATSAPDASCEEEFYGYAPVCYLANTGEYGFLYLDVPAGDVSAHTNVYELTDAGAVKYIQEPLALAIRSDSPLDPDWLLMSLDLAVSEYPLLMVPHAAYRLRENGLPEMIGGVYDLDGPWVRLREGGRFNPDNRENAAVSGGMWTLIAGQRMRPYQTDLNTFLDFVTDDWRVVRFAITHFGYGMTLDDSAPDELFEPDEAAG